MESQQTRHPDNMIVRCRCGGAISGLALRLCKCEPTCPKCGECFTVTSQWLKDTKALSENIDKVVREGLYYRITLNDDKPEIEILSHEKIFNPPRVD